MRRLKAEDLITTREAARLMNVHVNTIRRWSNRGIVVAYRVGPRADRRFLKSEIIRLAHKLHQNNGDERLLMLTPG